MQNISFAKVTNPVIVEENLLLRKRLFHELDRARDKRVVWVTGLPGSGKTTLVASYLSGKKLPCAWYHVDNGDVDPATFFYYLRYIIRDPAKRVRLPLLTPEYLLNIETFTSRYFKILSSMLPRHFILVFDNYHEIGQDAFLHRLVSETIMRMPQQGNIILISRTEPPEPFSMLITKSMMGIIGNESIKFTPEETAMLVRRLSGKNQGKETIQRLQHWTDGWAAGIILMLEQHKKQLEMPTRDSFSSRESIFSYFSAEVFDRINPEIRDFLMRTSFFPSMTIEMAMRMTRNQSSDKILAYLIKSHYFTIKHQNNSYKYHDLFRDFLLLRAKSHFNEEELKQIHRQAGIILQAHNKLEDAIEMFRRASDWKDVENIIKISAQDLISQGRNSVLETWIKSLPEEELTRDPLLLYWLGEASALFNPVQGRAYFEKAFKKYLSNRRNSKGVTPVKKSLHHGVYLSWCGIVETFFYEFGNYRQAEKWITAMEKIIVHYRKFPSRELEARVLSLMVQVLTFQRPMHPKIKTWAERAVSLVEYIKNPDLRAYYLSYITNYYSWTGNIVQFDILIHLMKSITRLESLPIKTKLLYEMFMAVHARHLSLKEQCLSAVHEALAIADEHSVHFFDHLIIAQALYLLFGLGDVQKIEELLQMMGPLVNQSSLLEVIQYNSMLGWLDKLHGNIQGAIEKIEPSLKMSLQMGSLFPEVVNRIALAELYYMQGDYKIAARYLRRSFFLSKKMRNYMLEYMCGLLQSAWFLEDKIFNNERKGLRLLKRTMSLGKKYDIINTFAETRQIRTKMCLKALEKGIEVPYVHKLIQRLELFPDPPPIAYENWPWAFKIYTLGSFKIFKESREVKLSRNTRSKPIELLQFLIVNHDKTVELDQISSVLWPDASGDYAHQTLDTTIHRLRKLLGSHDAVFSQAGRLSLNPEMFWIDVLAYEQHLKEIEIMLDEKRNTVKEKLKTAADAVFNLYKGPFLAQQKMLPWTITFRERLHDRFTQFVEQIGAYYRNIDDNRQATLIYKKGVVIDNQTEIFYQHLMSLYKSSGRYAEAASTYKRCAAVLSETHGIEPSLETKELYESVKILQRTNRMKVKRRKETA